MYKTLLDTFPPAFHVSGLRGEKGCGARPEIFGMHENANIAFQQQESDKILDVVLSVQPLGPSISRCVKNDTI